MERAGRREREKRRAAREASGMGGIIYREGWEVGLHPEDMDRRIWLESDCGPGGVSPS